MKNPAAATTAGTPGAGAHGTKVNPLNKSMFGTTPGKSDAAKEDPAAVDDLMVKMPSNFKTK